MKNGRGGGVRNEPAVKTTFKAIIVFLMRPQNDAPHSPTMRLR